MTMRRASRPPAGPPGTRAAPTARGTALLALALAGMALLQVTILSFLPVRHAVPDLVVAAVLAVAYGRGALAGGLAGAWAGLLLDLLPPAAGPVGGWMLVLVAVGAGMGQVVATSRPGPFGALLLVAVGAAAAVLARTAVLWFAGVQVSWSAAWVALTSGGYALLLAPLVLLMSERSRPGRRVLPHGGDQPLTPVGAP